MHNYKIFIPERCYSLPPNQFYTYLVLQPLCQCSLDGKSFVSHQSIFYYTFGTITPTRNEEEVIRDGLSGLIRDGVVTGRKLSKSGYEIEKKSFYKEEGEFFSYIYFNNIPKINKPALCKYYVILLSTINNKTKIGAQPITSLAEMIGCSERTVYRYNEELENLNLIYIRKHSNSANNYRSNIYGRYEDKLLIDKYADSHGYSKQSEGNFLRSVSSRYNAFVDGKQLTDDEEIKLYEDCLLYNKMMDEKQKYQKGSDYIRKKKDLSVFDINLF